MIIKLNFTLIPLQSYNVDVYNSIAITKSKKSFNKNQHMNILRSRRHNAKEKRRNMYFQVMANSLKTNYRQTNIINWSQRRWNVCSSLYFPLLLKFIEYHCAVELQPDKIMANANIRKKDHRNYTISSIKSTHIF